MARAGGRWPLRSSITSAGGQHAKTGSRDQRDAPVPRLAVEFEQLPHRLELIGLVQVVHSGGQAGPRKRQAC